MALFMTRSPTEDEAHKMLADWRATGPGMLRSVLWEQIREAVEEPRPHVVRYRAHGKIHYTPPEMFFLAQRVAPSPSDSEWFVPGT